MRPSCRIIHYRHEKLLGCLIRNPIPSLGIVVAEVVDFPNSLRIYSVGGNQIIWIDGLKIADSQGSVFNDRNMQPPGAAMRLAQAFTEIEILDIT